VSLKATGGALSFRSFIDGYVRVLDARGHKLTPLTLHPAQAEFVAAVDAIGPDGLRRYRTFAASWPKKAGKSSTASALALWALTSDPLAAEREVIIAATDLEQAATIIFQLAARMVKRHAWLSSRVKVGKFEMRYHEPASAGQVAHTSVLRAIPQDVRGSHGAHASCTIVDEAWAADTWDFIESLTPSPARLSPIMAFFSYAGLRSQQRAGVPWFDLLQRRERDPSLYVSHLAGPDAWQAIPWITPRWIADQRQLFETCPSKYARLVENTVSGADSGYLTAAEVADALADLAEPAGGEPGVKYWAAADLGLTFDLTAVLIGHVTTAGKFEVDVLRTWQGTKGAPVSVQGVEDEIVNLSARFRLARLVVDQWQAALLIERLRRRGVPNVRPVSIEPAKLDTITTLTKGCFSRRMVVLPRRLLDLREQLESLVVIETGARNRRRDRLRFDAGSGTGPAAHDDQAICLALALDASQGEIGRAQLPACTCPHSSPCCVAITGGGLPMGDRLCAECARWQVIKAQWLAAGGVPDLRTFIALTYSASAKAPAAWFC